MQIRLFETFAGIGSQHTAFRNISQRKDIQLELVGISEWDVYAVLAYYRINGMEFDEEYSASLSDSDIRDYFKTLPYSLDSKKLSTRVSSLSIAILRKLYQAHNELNNIPDVTTLKGEHIVEGKVNVLTYSFPCQDLSNAGLGKGMAKDSNTRSGLLWEIERVLDEITELKRDGLPKYLLMENVTAIVDKRHRPDYDLWKKKLDDLGYTSFDGTLNAIEFGIPQTRQRFFCLSILNPKSKYESLDLDFLLSDYKSECQPLANFLKVDYQNIKYKNEADLATPNHTKSRYEMFKKERTLSKLIENKLSFKNGFTNQYCVLGVHTHTLTTKQDRWNNGGMLEYFEKKFNEKQISKDVESPSSGYSKFRYLTNREAFLLMGFKECYIEQLINENFSAEKMYRQAGNSIVVNVLEAIFEGMIIKEESECN